MAKEPNLVDTLSAEPVKAFFVDMLTRDIDLQDAILDLLDNCVDGVVRDVGKAGLKKDTPYSGYFAEIKTSSSKFEIMDNCGGIPDERRAYAFRMGAPPKGRDLHLPTVGTYGIGMKRAMFKLGRNCLVETKTNTNEYSVRFPSTWFDDEDEWKVQVRHDDTKLEEAGTRITVTTIRDGVKGQLGHEGFLDKLYDQIATHYALIIAKGFRVTINGKVVKGKPIQLRFSKGEKGIRPFIFRTEVGGVEVFAAVGFTVPIPSEAEANSDTGAMSQGMYQAAEAGWSVVCNDRTVLYCDKTALTGWGEYPVPRYHNQFIAVSGIVEFRSDDASKLPMTTTKRGIDASSELYLDVKQKMREGMKLFTDFTNKWKGPKLASRGKEMIRDAEPMNLPELKAEASSLNLRSVSKKTSGEQYKPHLPSPPTQDDGTVRVSFSRPRAQVEALADRLFGEPKTTPSVVGEKCFDVVFNRRG
jgi:hypothetical protein